MNLFNSLVNVLISGIILGSLYAVMSMGLTLIYGIGRIFNFAQGAFILWGGYIMWLLSIKWHLPFWISFVAAAIILFVFGYVIDKVLLYPLRKKPEYDYGLGALLVTLGIAIAASNAGDLIFGTRIKTIDKVATGFVKFGEFTIPYHDIAIFVIAVGILVALEIFLRKTTIGTALRGVSQDPVGAKVVGMNLDGLYALTFALSAFLGAIAGILLAPKLFIAPFVGWETLFKAVIIVIFGGLGSIKGTLMSAFILGILEALVSMYLGMFWVQPMWFILLVVVLFIRPRGLFGEWA